MKFRFIGDEPSTVFGFDWLKGTIHDVDDPHAIGKLTHSALFEAVDVPQTVEDKEPAFDDYQPQPKRRGRPPKVVTGEIDGDEN